MRYQRAKVTVEELCNELQLGENLVRYVCERLPNPVKGNILYTAQLIQFEEYWYHLLSELQQVFAERIWSILRSIPEVGDLIKPVLEGQLREMAKNMGAPEEAVNGFWDMVSMPIERLYTSNKQPSTKLVPTSIAANRWGTSVARLSQLRDELPTHKKGRTRYVDLAASEAILEWLLVWAEGVPRDYLVTERQWVTATAFRALVGWDWICIKEYDGHQVVPAKGLHMFETKYLALAKKLQERISAACVRFSSHTGQDIPAEVREWLDRQEYHLSAFESLSSFNDLIEEIVAITRKHLPLRLPVKHGREKQSADPVSEGKGGEPDA